jgi:hypothetical protein
MAHNIHAFQGHLKGVEAGELPPDEGLNSLEMPVVATLKKYLANPTTDPLLTINEDDLILPIEDPEGFFYKGVSQSAVPHDVRARRLSGELTEQQLGRNMQIARNIVRNEKAEMFVERIMVATHATDTCRSLFWIATGSDFVPVEADDTFATVTRRTGDHVTNLLQGGRDQRVLRNAAMDRLTQTIRGKFDSSPSVQLELAVLAGMNSRKKVDLYIKGLVSVRRGYKDLSVATRKKLDEYRASRSSVFQEKLDLYELIPQTVEH